MLTGRVTISHKYRWPLKEIRREKCWRAALRGSSNGAMLLSKWPESWRALSTGCKHGEQTSHWCGTRHPRDGGTAEFRVPSSGRLPVLILMALRICTLLVTKVVWDEVDGTHSPNPFTRGFPWQCVAAVSPFPEIIMREATICYIWGTHPLLSLPKGNLNRKLFFQYPTGLHLPWLQLVWLCCHLGMKPFTLLQLPTQLRRMLYITKEC